MERRRGWEKAVRALSELRGELSNLSLAGTPWGSYSWSMSAWLDKIWPVVMGNTRMSRRQATSVQRQSSEEELLREARQRNFHVALIGPQYFIFRDAIDVKG